MSTCRLCLEDKDLIANSHIIPDFLYQNIYDDKHRMIRTAGLNVATARTIQTGEKEGGILCRECDNERIGSLETYAHRVLFTEKERVVAQNVQHSDGLLTSTQCEGINYSRFKLFLLSILWRASISSSEFFSEVDLGKLEEPMRRMIFAKDPMGQMDFPCLVSSWRLTQRQMTSGVITSPRKIKGDNGGTRYLLQIGQLVLMFFVSKQDRPEWLQDAVITPENRMSVIHFTDQQGMELMETLFGSVFVQALSLSRAGR